MDENTEKKIIISGIKSKYQVNNLNKKNNDVKKRVITEKWTFTKEQLNCENQFKLILDISSNNYNFTNWFTLNFHPYRLPTAFRSTLFFWTLTHSVAISLLLS
jgi:hypothetical protein